MVKNEARRRARQDVINCCVRRKKRINYATLSEREHA
jgi:hypothetical protein